MRSAHRYPRRIIDRLERIGGRLAQLRTKAGLTQEEVAYRAGLSRRSIWQIEAGHPCGEIAAVAAVADVLGYRLTVTAKESSTPDARAARDLIVDRLSGWRPRGGHSSLSLSM
ncbi:helix-turn-helix domain-containing protein [Mycobacteroides abscessus]|nr:helix-turn-helix domain-containing protein [Mycobacteroides abscessus]SKT99603.1 anaerobic benzoate catabolism transcriptional regulator [Mycobacteroides abscessus subsp. massiliense]SKU03742.1 anaerobic benzoate catabolism transcriptional regulator [Mycobacteroides abscessus subsp. massiliense]